MCCKVEQGATRMIFGSRKSHFTPTALSLLRNYLDFVISSSLDIRHSSLFSLRGRQFSVL